MASLTRWTWVYASSGRWWWIGKPGVLQSMGSQRVRHDWATELNWPRGRPLLTHASVGDSWTLTGKSCSFSCGVTAPFSWVLMHTRFCLCPPRVCFPSPVEVLQSNPTGLPSQIPWGLSVPLPDPQVGESVVGPRTVVAVQELLWYNCSPSVGRMTHGSVLGLMVTSCMWIYATRVPPRSAAVRAPDPSADHCRPMPLQETTRHSKARLASWKPTNAGVGSVSLLQWIFPTQESNRGLLHCRWILYQLSSQGIPTVFY